MRVRRRIVLVLRKYGVAGSVIHTPGHTAGSVSVVLESGHAFVGDMFRGIPPQLSLGMFYEDETTLEASIRTLASHGPMTIYLDA